MLINQVEQQLALVEQSVTLAIDERMAAFGQEITRGFAQFQERLGALDRQYEALREQILRQVADERATMRAFEQLQGRVAALEGQLDAIGARRLAPNGAPSDVDLDPLRQTAR